LATKPSLYWRLGEASGTKAVDLSGNGHDGTYKNGPTLGAGGGIYTSPDTAVQFAAASGHRVDSAYNPFIVGTARTFAGWALQTKNATNLRMIGGNGTNAVYLRIEDANNKVDWRANTSVGADVSWSAAWPAAGVWVFFAIVFDDPNDTAELFINGASWGKKTTTDTFGASPGNFQASQVSVPWNGSLDEIMVWERALSAGEIMGIAKAGIPGLGGLPYKHPYSI